MVMLLQLVLSNVIICEYGTVVVFCSITVKFSHHLLLCFEFLSGSMKCL